MKIVILTGSYNLHGTSNTLVDEFIKGAEENNNEIIIYTTDDGQVDIEVYVHVLVATIVAWMEIVYLKTIWRKY